jgi:hypothetical protein
MFIAAFAFFQAVPLWAQRGGHAGSGGHFSGGHSAGFASHGFSGGRVGPSHFSAGRSGFRGSIHSSSGVIITNGFHTGFHNGFHHHGFSSNCFGFRCAGGFINPWWGYSPWLWYDWQDMDNRFDADYYNNLALANQMDQQSLEQQRLMRQEQEDRDQDSYAPRSPTRGEPSRSSGEEKQGSPLLPATILVFRDARQQEVGNYAIVGQTLWNFAAGRTQKIPLSSLDIAATEKANDDRGLTFRVPNSNEAQ